MATNRFRNAIVFASALGTALLGACGGNDGSPRMTGSAGTTGTAGTSSAGSAGTTGTAGTMGSGGTAGTAGTTGGAGASGAAGSSAAGTTGAAGTGVAGAAGGAGTGAAGAAGATGTAGTGAGGSGLPNATKSDGCGMDPGQPLMTQTKYSIMVTAAPTAYQARVFYAWLPANYDKNRAYPTVIIGPGCGGSGNMTIPMMDASGDQAIIIGLQYSPNSSNQGCFMTESATSPEIVYFDEVVKQTETKFCVDKSRIFMEGFSSGSWLTNLIGCARGNVIKAQGNASGCTPPLPTCTGPIPQMAVHDMGDGNNAYSCGVSNRDRIIKLNGCMPFTMAIPYDPGPMVMAPPGKTINCMQAVGCMPGKPVVWCATTGLGHNDGSNTGASTFGFWKFWMSLP